MNSAVEKMRQMERELLNTQSSMLQNLQSGNLTGLNADLANFNQKMQQAEMLKRGIDERLNQANSFKWNNNNFQIFNTSGLERAKQEISAAKSLSEQLNADTTKINRKKRKYEAFSA